MHLVLYLSRKVPTDSAEEAKIPSFSFFKTALEKRGFRVPSSAPKAVHDLRDKLHGEPRQLENRLLHHLNAIQTSASWQLARPLRAAEVRWPRLLCAFAALPKVAWWALTLRLPQRLPLLLQARKLREGGLFDERWYVEQNPDVVVRGVDPVMHWLVEGWKQGQDPSPLFDSNC